MGISVSSWQLANAVAERGQIGVVSGTAIDLVLARSLLDGDPGGHRRRAIAAFPDQALSQRILDKYFVEGGRASEKGYSSKGMVGEAPSIHLQELLIMANFVEVFLAKEGHDVAAFTVFGMPYANRIRPCRDIFDRVRSIFSRLCDVRRFRYVDECRHC